MFSSDLWGLRDSQRTFLGCKVFLRLHADEKVTRGEGINHIWRVFRKKRKVVNNKPIDNCLTADYLTA